jgi:phosphoserine phosphatase
MLTVTFLAAPGSALDPAVSMSLQNAWGGGELRWLSPGEAVEFDLPALPDTFGHAATELDMLGIDVAAQPAGKRRKKLLLADMDSTMIEQECIDELADEAGVGERVAAITARAMNGELDFQGALRERVALLKGLPVEAIDRVLERRITPMPGGTTLVATMKANGARTALISGGFTAFSGPVAAMLGFDEHRANSLLSENGHLTGGVAEPILGREAKVAALREITAGIGITPLDAIVVGDGANDLGMLALAGTGVALHAKPAVQEQARLRINHGDLTALLYLQGYRREEFIGLAPDHPTNRN